MSLDGKAYAIRQSNKVIWEDTGSDPDYPYDPELKRVMLEFPGRGWYLDRKPVIRDVRMPLLTLAVFYAGLFFILATPSAKSPKS